MKRGGRKIERQVTLKRLTEEKEKERERERERERPSHRLELN